MTAISTHIDSANWIADYSLKIPKISFGPFHVIEAAPWLFLATVLRIAGYGTSIALVCVPLAMVCIVMAFLLAFRRTIENSGGQTGLGQQTFSQQLEFVKTSMRWWFGLTVALTLIFSAHFGFKATAPVFLVSLDGIAFDVVNRYARLIAPAVTIMMFFAALAAANDLKPDLKNVVSGIAYHAQAMILAYALLVGFLFAFAPIQAGARSVVLATYFTGGGSVFKNLMVIGFVFCFACARLWLSLLILTAVFKWSCQRTRTLSALEY